MLSRINMDHRMIILKKVSLSSRKRITYVFIKEVPPSGESLIIHLYNDKLQDPPEVWCPLHMSIETMVESHLGFDYHVVQVAEAAQDMTLCWKELMEALDE